MKEFINDTWLERSGLPVPPETLTLLWSSVVSIYGLGALLSTPAGGYLAGKYGKYADVPSPIPVNKAKVPSMLAKRVLAIHVLPQPEGLHTSTGQNRTGDKRGASPGANVSQRDRCTCNIGTSEASGPESLVHACQAFPNAQAQP